MSSLVLDAITTECVSLYVTYLIFNRRLGSILHENFRQLPPGHGGGNVEGRVVVLFVLVQWDEMKSGWGRLVGMSQLAKDAS